MPPGPTKINEAAMPESSGGQLAEADYNFLCRLIYERSRIHLGPDKRVLVTSRLAKRVRHHGCKNYGEYCDLLRSPAGRGRTAVSH